MISQQKKPLLAKEKEVAPAKRPTVSRCTVSASQPEGCAALSVDAPDAITIISMKAYSKKLNRNLKAATDIHSVVATVGRLTVKRSTVSATTLEYPVPNFVTALTAATMKKVKVIKAVRNDFLTFDILLLSIQIHKVNE